MTTQRSLFETQAAVSQYGERIEPAPLPARKSDPVTSQMAAAEIADKLHGCELVFLQALARLGTATAYQVATSQRVWPNSTTIRKRAGGLKTKGLIAVVDRNGKVPETGRRCERFRLTNEGKEAIR